MRREKQYDEVVPAPVPNYLEPPEHRTESEYARHMAIRHWNTAWALVYMGDAIKALAEAVSQRDMKS